MWPRLVAILVVLGTTSPALAWSNGTDGYNSYGTHDWILDQALEAAGDDADWVRRRVALRATDDPDSKDGIEFASSPWWHVYDDWGDNYGATPETVEHGFEVIRRRT